MFLSRLHAEISLHAVAHTAHREAIVVGGLDGFLDNTHRHPRQCAAWRGRLTARRAWLVSADLPERRISATVWHQLLAELARRLALAYHVDLLSGWCRAQRWFDRRASTQPEVFGHWNSK